MPSGVRERWESVRPPWGDLLSKVQKLALRPDCLAVLLVKGVRNFKSQTLLLEASSVKRLRVGLSVHYLVEFLERLHQLLVKPLVLCAVFRRLLGRLYKLQKLLGRKLVVELNNMRNKQPT